MVAEPACDPDLEAVGWLESYVPLGIANPIQPGGVFPILSPEEVEQAKTRYAHPETLLPDFENYSS